MTQSGNVNYEKVPGVESIQLIHHHCGGPRQYKNGKPYLQLFAFHGEVLEMCAVNYKFDGNKAQAKLWMFIQLTDSNLKELRSIYEYVGGPYAKCSQWLHHKLDFPMLRSLLKSGVVVHYLFQRSGDVVFAWNDMPHFGALAGVGNDLNIACNFLNWPKSVDVSRTMEVINRRRARYDLLMQSKVPVMNRTNKEYSCKFCDHQILAGREYTTAIFHHESDVIESRNSQDNGVDMDQHTILEALEIWRNRLSAREQTSNIPECMVLNAPSTTAKSALSIEHSVTNVTPSQPCQIVARSSASATSCITMPVGSPPELRTSVIPNTTTTISAQQRPCIDSQHIATMSWRHPQLVSNQIVPLIPHVPAGPPALIPAFYVTPYNPSMLPVSSNPSQPQATSVSYPAFGGNNNAWPPGNSTTQHTHTSAAVPITHDVGSSMQVDSMAGLPASNLALPPSRESRAERTRRLMRRMCI